MLHKAAGLVLLLLTCAGKWQVLHGMVGTAVRAGAPSGAISPRPDTLLAQPQTH